MTGQLYNTAGQVIGDIELDDAVFAAPVNKQVLYQLLKAEQANLRVGTASVRSRGQVSGSTAKPWRQKGTGNARAGHKRSPIWRTGGVVFGPQARDFNQKMPGKIKNLAYRSLFSLKAENNLRIVEKFSPATGKTRELVKIIDQVRPNNSGRTVLVCGDASEELIRAGRNIADFKLLNYRRLSCHALLYANSIILMADVVAELTEFLAAKTTNNRNTA